MKARIDLAESAYTIDLHAPLDISIPMRSGSHNPNAFHIPHPRFEPIRVGDFVGSVAAGSGANCENLYINAHGNGTHTECVGHITPHRVSIHESLQQFFFPAQLISVRTETTDDGDRVIPLAEVLGKLDKRAHALVMRTMDVEIDRHSMCWSGTNPPYISHALCAYLAEMGIMHLLTDLPSVDREEDGGAMLAHKAFWHYPEAPRMNATITEMIAVDPEITDGFYLLNLQIASLQTDASPSKPLLFRVN